MLLRRLAVHFLVLAPGALAWHVARSHMAARRNRNSRLSALAERDDILRAKEYLLGGADVALAAAAPAPASAPAPAAAAPRFGAATNTALVFLKPHAVTPRAVSLVKAKLVAAGCFVVRELVVGAADIDRLQLIDAHYGTLAQLAMATDPKTLALTPALKEKFAEVYGVEWDRAPLMTNGEALKAVAQLKGGGVSGKELETMWRKGPFVKLSPGCYVARLVADDVPGLAQRTPFTLNGFYPAMREQFVAPGAQVHALVVSFSAEKLPWSSFRESVVGATDPSKASADSIRGAILSGWSALGLPFQPSMAANGCHASAGPLEGLKERLVWGAQDPSCSDASLAADGFGAQLLACGVPAATLRRWLAENPIVKAPGGIGPDKVFDLTEGMDSATVLALAPNFEIV